MRILAIGDIIGEESVNKLKEILPNYKKKEQIDFIIANGENTAEGMGINKKIYTDLLKMGIDVVTMGNHTWGKKDIFSILDSKNLIRPANYSKNVLGKGYEIFECKDKKIAVINLIGRVDMNVLSENPFIVAEGIINKIKEKADIIIVDFHAEATAEKICMGYFLDGKVSVVFGTHTHVQTADEKILDKGTGYITDLGMTGPEKSVIGMDMDVSIKRFLTSIPERYAISKDNKIIINGCIFDINDNTCKTDNILRVKML